jgi:hypothetical protein
LNREIHVVCSYYDEQYYLHGAFNSEGEAVETLEDIVDGMNREFERRTESLYVRENCRYEVREVSLKVDEEDPRQKVRW